MDHPAPPPSNAVITKLRLMCSYGGYVLPRPNTKFLCYAGGDTRIISLNPSATSTVAALTAHISATLSVPTPFSLKYQLPLHDLDSLISLSNDDDLLVFLEEIHSCASSPIPSRIRLFLFKPTRQFTTRLELSHSESAQPMIQHPKTEAWFVDALKSAKIMQKGQNFGVAFDGEGQNEGLGGGELGINCGVSVQESMVLETNSSFGSTSSSASSSNLPPIKGNVEDGAVNLLDKKVKLAEPKLNASDNSFANSASYQHTGLHQEPVVQVAPTETGLPLNTYESNINICDPLSEFHMQKTIQACGYPLSAQLDSQLHQKSQLGQAPVHYIPHNPFGPLPTTSYYHVYQSQLYQQQQLHYPPNQPYPTYFLPVRQMQPNNLPILGGFTDTASKAPLVPTKLLYKEVESVPPELPSQFYRASLAATLPVHIPTSENQQQFGGLTQLHQQPQFIGKEFDDDLARVQIYKSQPPPPKLPSQYQTMTKSTELLLPEALAQLHTDNINHIATGLQKENIFGTECLGE